MTENKEQSRWAGPLDGLRVIDLTRVLAGPFCTQSLGDLGAEVLKIEPPGLGDETRHFPPFVGGESHYFLGINRNKKSLVVDLQQPAGADIWKAHIARAPRFWLAETPNVSSQVPPASLVNAMPINPCSAARSE